MTLEQFEQFRQQTGGGVPCTVYIRKATDGFEVKFKTADSRVNVGILMDTMINAISMTSQQLGMIVKTKDKSETQ